MSTGDDLLAALAAIDADVAEAEEHLRKLRAERSGAEALLARLGVTAASSPKSPPTEAPPTSDVRGARSARSGNAKAIAGIMAEHPKGVSLVKLADIAAAKLDLSYDQTRSAVTYLKRQGQADTVRRGVWRLVDTPRDAAPPVAGGVSGGDRSNSEDRSSQQEEGVPDGTIFPGDHDAGPALWAEHRTANGPVDPQPA
jgi:hypothetical protein